MKGFEITQKSTIITALREENSIKTFLQNSFLSKRYIERIEAGLDEDTGYKTSEELIYDSTKEFLGNILQDELFLEIMNKEKKMIISNHDFILNRPEIDEALKGSRIYIIRKIKNSYYLFISDILNLVEQDFIISVIKDITYIYELRNEQQLIFITVALTSLIILGILIVILTGRITKPLEKLADVTQNITRGNYDVRSEVDSRDEIGLLSSRFNSMASEIENKIETLNEQAEQKQRFIDNLTHELKNPLTSIIGYADYLRTTKYDEKIFVDSINLIHTEGKRILELTDRLFDLILYKNKEINLKEENIEKLFYEIGDILKYRFKEKSIDFKIEAEGSIIKIDKALMKIALANLIENAIKASEFGGKITAGFKDNSFFVKDNGKGMPEAEIHKITEPFYRIHKARTQNDSGVGLGLSICQEIFQRHGYKLKIKSKLEEGTEIYILIN